MLVKAALVLTGLASSYLPEAGPVRRLLAMPAALVTAISENPIATVSAGIVGILMILAALGILRREQAGWLLAMVLTGVFLAAEIWAFTQGQPGYLWMALDVVTVFYLNQSDVRAIVGAGSDEPVEQVTSP